MYALIDHVQANYLVYGAAVIILLPIFVVLRRYTVPVFLYALEFCIYATLVHVVTHFVILLAAWFKDQSTMKRAYDKLDQSFNPGWETPILEFWRRDLYVPSWIFYFEIFLLFGIVILMWRYRPMRIQKPKGIPPRQKKPTSAYGSKSGGGR